MDKFIRMDCTSIQVPDKPVETAVALLLCFSLSVDSPQVTNTFELLDSVGLSDTGITYCLGNYRLCAHSSDEGTKGELEIRTGVADCCRWPNE